jgi:rod shape-determining protein MreB
LHKTVFVSPDDFEVALRPKIDRIIAMIKSVLEQVPPELASDIIDKGIIMVGGTSQLRNLDRLLTQETGVPCHVAEEPLLCVAKGTGIALENLDLYRRAISKR